MIWSAGKIFDDAELRVPVIDRTFEHGLGLFETLRTWDGRAPLLDLHRARMLDSARALGIALESDFLPDAEAVTGLRAAEGWSEDRVLRITASGGTPGGGLAAVWMRSAPLPPPISPGGWSVQTGGWTVSAHDPTARHKMLNYWTRRIAHEQAQAAGFDEALASLPDRRLVEGSRTSLFVVRGGAVVVPCRAGPIVPGVLRSVALELIRANGRWTIQEVGGIDPDLLDRADEVFLTNAVRGIIPVGRVDERSWQVPGPVTQMLQEQLVHVMGDGR